LKKRTKKLFLRCRAERATPQPGPVSQIKKSLFASFSSEKEVLSLLPFPSPKTSNIKAPAAAWPLSGAQK
jgi:hypothetical protein